MRESERLKKREREIERGRLTEWERDRNRDRESERESLFPYFENFIVVIVVMSLDIFLLFFLITFHIIFISV